MFQTIRISYTKFNFAIFCIFMGFIAILLFLDIFSHNTGNNHIFFVNNGIYLVIFLKIFDLLEINRLYQILFYVYIDNSIY
jgi:hypothetical protein